MRTQKFIKEDGKEYNLNFSYRITTRKLYKKTTGKNFNDEIKKVGEIFDNSGFIQVQKLQDEGKDVPLSLKQGLGLLTSDSIIDFLIEIMPCLYINSNNDQNESSYNEFVSYNLEDAYALDIENIGWVLEMFSDFNKNPSNVNAEKKMM